MLYCNVGDLELRRTGRRQNQKLCVTLRTFVMYRLMPQCGRVWAYTERYRWGLLLPYVSRHSRMIHMGLVPCSSPVFVEDAKIVV